jgi:hypothetical protein
MLTGSQVVSYLTPYTWHQIKITFANGTTRVYVDDVSVGTSNTAPVYDLADPWILTLGNFDGDLDEVRISKTLR